MTTESNKQVAFVRLLEDEDPKVLAAELDTPLSTILRWKAELKVAKENDTVKSLINLDAMALAKLADMAKFDVPEVLEDDLKSKTKELVNGAQGLQKLEINLQDTAIYINGRIRAMAAIATSVGEITELTSALCALQSSFFGKGTQIQVINNNNLGANPYDNLKDVPGTYDNA
jgi:hypothetical protein